MVGFINVKIEIGGSITKDQSKSIYEEALADAASPYNDGIFTYDEMMESVKEDGEMIFYGENKEGELPLLEKYLKKEGIAFLKSSDSHSDLRGIISSDSEIEHKRDIVKFDGNISSPSVLIASFEGVSEIIAKEVLDELKKMNLGKAIKLLEGALFDGTIPVISIKEEDSGLIVPNGEDKVFMININHDRENYPTFCEMYQECDPGYTRADIGVYSDRFELLSEGVSAEERKFLMDELDRAHANGNYIQVVE